MCQIIFLLFVKSMYIINYINSREKIMNNTNKIQELEWLISSGYYEVFHGREVRYVKKIKINDSDIIEIFEIKENKTDGGYILSYDHIIEKIFSDTLIKDKKYSSFNKDYVIKKEIEHLIYNDFINFYHTLTKKNKSNDFDFKLKRDPNKKKNNLLDKFNNKQIISEYKTISCFDYKKDERLCIKCQKAKPIKSHLISEFILKNLESRSTLKKNINENVIYKYFPFNVFDCFISINPENAEDLIIATHSSPGEYTAAYLYCETCDNQDFENEKKDLFFTKKSDNNQIINIFTKRYTDFIYYKYNQMTSLYKIFKDSINKDKLSYIESKIETYFTMNDMILRDKNQNNEINFFVEVDYLFPFASMSLVEKSKFRYIFKSISSCSFNSIFNDDSYCVISFFRKRNSTIISLSFKNLGSGNYYTIERNIQSLYNDLSKNEVLIIFIQNCFINTIDNESEFFLSSEFFINSKARHPLLSLTAFKNSEFKDIIISTENDRNVFNDDKLFFKNMSAIFMSVFEDIKNIKKVNAEIFINNKAKAS